MSTKWISDEGETSVRKESINCGHEARAGGEVRAPPVRLGGGTVLRDGRVGLGRVCGGWGRAGERRRGRVAGEQTDSGREGPTLDRRRTEGGPSAQGPDGERRLAAGGLRPGWVGVAGARLSSPGSCETGCLRRVLRVRAWTRLGVRPLDLATPRVRHASSPSVSPAACAQRTLQASSEGPVGL